MHLYNPALSLLPFRVSPFKMSETNKDAFERENDGENTVSTSAFHEHLWWIAIVVIVVAVFVVVRALGAI